MHAGWLFETQTRGQGEPCEPATSSLTSSGNSTQHQLGSLILQIKLQSPGHILGPVPLHILWRLCKCLEVETSEVKRWFYGASIAPVTKGPNAHAESFLVVWVPEMS